jgi:L-aspartate oxidase
MMGGTITDLEGRSTIAGLYAVGEASCTGLHGANRLASNSLSECFVFARRAVAHTLSISAAGRAPVAESELARLRELPEPPQAQPSTREALWRDAGVVRSAEGLEALLDDPHPLARLIARCALARTESRGAHLRSDCPERDPALDLHHAVLGDDDSPAWETWT